MRGSYLKKKKQGIGKIRSLAFLPGRGHFSGKIKNAAGTAFFKEEVNENFTRERPCCQPSFSLGTILSISVGYG